MSDTDKVKTALQNGKRTAVQIQEATKLPTWRVRNALKQLRKDNAIWTEINVPPTYELAATYN